MQTTFADVIGNISLSAGVVRMDMLRVAGQDPETKQPRFENAGQLAMPIEGFLRSLAMQEKIKDELITSGLVKVGSNPSEIQ